MEREPSNAIDQYRQHLLESLRTLPTQPHEERPGRLQVFVNHECVGDLDCGAASPNFTFTSRERSVQLIELRSETGTLIGALSAPEIGSRLVRLAWGRQGIEVAVHNRLEGGSLRLAYQAAPSLWEKLSRAARGIVPAWSEAGLQPAALRGMAVAQIVLLLAVGYLIGDRVFDRMQRTDESAQAAAKASQELVASEQAQDAVNRLEEKLAALVKTQVASSQALDGHHKIIAAVQRAVDEVAQQQKQMGSQMVSVQQVEEHQERIARQSSMDVERMARLLMGQVQSERAQLRDELHSLSMANEHLAKHVSSMEKKNQDLTARLRTAGIDVSSKVGSAEPSTMVAKETTASDQAGMTGAEARSDASPLTFFVSFQDGTTEESIDRWFQDLHARKGAADSGWYSVEVPRPVQQPAERFMEGLKNVKIVKAVATNRSRLPTR